LPSNIYIFITNTAVALHTDLSLWHAHTDLPKVIRLPTLPTCVCCSVLQCVAVWCSVVQYIAVCCCTNGVIGRFCRSLFTFVSLNCTLAAKAHHESNEYPIWRGEDLPNKVVLWVNRSNPLTYTIKFPSIWWNWKPTLKKKNWTEIKQLPPSPSYGWSNQITSPHQLCYRSLS